MTHHVPQWLSGFHQTKADVGEAGPLPPSGEHARRLMKPPRTGGRPDGTRAARL